MSVNLRYRNTLRGVRKCSRCGTFNGNRASICKNRACQQKMGGDTSTEAKGLPSSLSCAVRLVQNYGQLYSVCLGNGYRDFFQTSIESDGSISVLSATTGASLPSDDKEAIKRLILDCKTVAIALPLLKPIIDALLVSDAKKRFLWEMSTQCTNPLVQRVANELFVVGRLQSEHGMYHVVIVKKNRKISQLQCDCQPVFHRKVPPQKCWHVLAAVTGLLSSQEPYEERWEPLLQQFLGESTTLQRCDESNDALGVTNVSIPTPDGELLTEFHPIAGQSIEMTDCILNPTMMQLFNDDEQPALISFDALSGMPIDGPIFELAIGDTMIASLPAVPCSNDLLATNADSLQVMDCQIELMDEFDPTDRIDICPSDIECDEGVLLPASVIENLSTENEPKEKKKKKLVEVTAKKAALRRSAGLEKGKLVRGSYSVRKLMKTLESNGIVFNRMRRSDGGKEDVPVDTSSAAPSYEATLCSLSFTRWLEVVIEQLNAAIDYNTDAKRVAETFRIHEDFYRCLRARFSVGHRSRQPEQTDSLPESPGAVGPRPQLFRFSHHRSVLHVFRTNRMQLAFEKSFVRSADDRFIATNPEEDLLDSDGKSEAPSVGQPIQSHRYSTYIKMGRYKHEPDPNLVYYFCIKWTGGVLPRSGFGDIEISFEYGHRVNNHYVTSVKAALEGF